MNNVQLTGRLVRDPEVRYSQGAAPIAIARYTLAVNRRFQKNGQRDADFISCVAFGKSGEFAEKFFKKGQRVGVCGRLQVNEWEDTEGKKHWKTEVIVEEQEFCDSAKIEGGQAERAEKPSGDGFYPIDEKVEDSDLPF